MRRDADIHSERVIAADSLKAAVLNETKKLYLQRGWKLGDFVATKNAKQRPRPTSPNRNVAGSQSASFIGVPPGFEIDDISFGGVASFELNQRRTGAFCKGIEAGRAIGTGYRTTVVVKHDDSLFADQKVPVASDAVVAPRPCAERARYRTAARLQTRA